MRNDVTDETCLKVPQKLAQDIANYLSTQPYKEVAQLIADLLQCPAVEKEQKNEKTNAKSLRP